jgi:hypothetical protein
MNDQLNPIFQSILNSVANNKLIEAKRPRIKRKPIKITK